jgi:hypothetical protein
MKTEWISVKDQLPNYYGDVLTINKSGFYHVCCFHPNSNRFTRKDSRPATEHRTVTYWMIIPEPPKQ